MGFDENGEPKLVVILGLIRMFFLFLCLASDLIESLGEFLEE